MPDIFCTLRGFPIRDRPNEPVNGPAQIRSAKLLILADVAGEPRPLEYPASITIEWYEQADATMLAVLAAE